MDSVTIRVSRSTHATLRRLSEQLDVPMTEILDEAIGAYHRQRFFADLNAGYAALKGQPAAWADQEGERAAWETTLGDGLEDDGHGA